MPKLPAFTAKKLIKKLTALGFVEDHQTGSHKVFYHPGTGRRAVIPYHVRDLPKGTLLAIIREAGLEREDLY
jgi:predicted RNA binding protein YcfA (HicA-like mRNA interferase family)